MTYCVGVLTGSGLVVAADSRSNAGLDHFASVRKLALFEQPGERVMALLAAGNLATTQAVVTLLGQRLGAEPGTHDLFAATTMFDAARMVGAVLREVIAYDAPHVEPHGDPSASFLFAGQLKGGRHRLFLIYAAGNFIEATPETPFLQAGETKYGKPILDRVITYDASLAAAAKCALLSFDSTMRSNLSVAPPIDIWCYRAGSLCTEIRVDIQEDDAYLAALRAQFGAGMLDLFRHLPDPAWAPRADAGAAELVYGGCWPATAVPAFARPWRWPPRSRICDRRSRRATRVLDRGGQR
jgi:putative proteasome-type protease